MLYFSAIFWKNHHFCQYNFLRAFIGKDRKVIPYAAELIFKSQKVKNSFAQLFHRKTAGDSDSALEV